MNKVLAAQYVLGIVAMVVFAYISSYYPQYNTEMIIAYFILMTLMMFALTGKQAGQLMRDMQEIQAAEVVYKVRKETSAKLKEKDFAKLKEEMAGQWKSILVGFVPLIALIMVFYIPPLRDAFFSLGGLFTEDKQLANFISFLILYGIFYVVSVPLSLINMRRQARHGTLNVANEYVVTEKGILVDGRLPIRFPLPGKVEVNNRRRFVEVHTIQETMGMNIKTKVRLYTPEPAKLARILREYSEKASRRGEEGEEEAGKA